MKTRLLWCLCLAALSTTLVTSAVPQDRGARVALVIGNANYPDASTPLSTTSRDARTVADELRRSDFDVDLKENLGKEEMQRAIDAFTGKIRSGSAALFYFNGYGIQAGRQTFLVPINAQLWTEADVRRDGINIDAVLAEMHRRDAKVKIVILDAARRNPFERRFRSSAAGLAALDAPTGTLAIFSAAPGRLINESTGTNSLFLGELIKELRSPNLTAEEVFSRARIGVSRASNSEQVPWVASSLSDDFYFGPSRPGTTTPARPSVTPSQPAPAPPPPQVATPAPAPAPPPPQARPQPQPQPQPQSQPPPSAALTQPQAPTRAGSRAGDSFRDCPDCPELVVVPAGSFNMGSASEYENPIHRVTIGKSYAIGRREVTFDEWDRCVDAGGCRHRPSDRDWGRGERPVINVSWNDAKAFVNWMSQKTGKTYRLPTEAEWEYAARGGTDSTYWWGGDLGTRQANCAECKTGEASRTMPVGSFKANAFGLFDTAGNAAEWVEDCWNDNYRGAPVNGAAWTAGQCAMRVLRGGAFDSQSRYLRSASRFRYDSDVRYSANGFRVVRELD
jgi:formylglycine-generating enzyme required for sulfatase activity